VEAEQQRGKDTEANLTVSFTQKLQEQSLRIVALEAEKTRLEKFIASDLKESQQIAQALQGELEKRLKELTDAIAEKHGLGNEKAALGARVKELEAALTRKAEAEDAATASKVGVARGRWLSFHTPDNSLTPAIGPIGPHARRLFSAVVW